MTEVPEHLLQRSRERRAALGLGGDEGEAQGTPAAAPSTAGTSVSPASATPAPAAAPAPAAPVAPAPPPPPPPYVAAAMARPKIPAWALPVLAMLPIWAIVYAGALVIPEEGITDPVLLEGQALYNQSCASCHGNDGGGGVGRPLSGGEVVLTFPDPADHIAFVTNGSPAAGTPYGNPERPGGQHISGEIGQLMPPFGQSLTEEEILAVVRYEREILSGEIDPALAAGGGAPAPGDTAEGAPTDEAQSEGGEVGAEGENAGAGATES